MRTFIIVLLVLLLIDCKHTTNQRNESISQLVSLDSDSVLRKAYSNPLSVIYTNYTKHDTMILKLFNDSLYITPLGKVFKNKKLFFDIKSEIEIEKIYFQPAGGDFVVFYEYKDDEGAGSMAKKISTQQNKIIWESPIYAFNMAIPSLIGDYAYLSTLGFIGKLNIINGKYAWKFEDLDKKYSMFSEPVFLKDSLVVFLRKDWLLDSIIVDDKNGIILKMY